MIALWGRFAIHLERQGGDLGTAAVTLVDGRGGPARNITVTTVLLLFP